MRVRARYLKQSRHKVVEPVRWGGWRSMWLRRPRVRTNGFYCLATEWNKPATQVQGRAPRKYVAGVSAGSGRNRARAPD